MNTDATLGYLRIKHRTHPIVLQKLENHYDNKEGYFIVVKDVTERIAKEYFGRLKNYHLEKVWESKKKGDFYFRVATNDAREQLEKLAKKPEFFMFRGWRMVFDEAIIREL